MKTNITKRTITREITEYVGKCEKCGKEIRGSTSSQVAFNLGVHQNSKECKNEKS